MGLASVIKDIAPLYGGPMADAERLDEALFGESVQVMDESEGGWCYIRTPHSTEGYTPAACLEQNADVAAAWRKYEKHIVLAPYMDVQNAPQSAAGVIASVPRGGLVVSLGKPGLDGWQKVGLPSGAVGYTRASYVGEVISDWSLMNEDDMRWNLVESALSYNGTAYRAGGRTTLGIDGVGLVAMSYLLNGVESWREPFFKGGLAPHKIPTNKMDEGDILYFPNSLGIYIGGDKFVHVSEQPGAEGVVVSSMNKKVEAYRQDLAEHIVAVASLF